MESKKSGRKTVSLSNGFTIVELLVVIVVIGILAAITIVSYTGISQKAAVATLTSDLDSASRQFKLYQVTSNIGYPDSLDSNYCPIPADSARCLKPSPGVSYMYASNNATTPQTFCITATKGSTIYKITNDSAPVQGECIDSYDLTAWYPMDGNVNDYSGNNNNGTLYGTPSVVDGKTAQAYRFINSQYLFTGMTNMSPDVSISFYMKHNGSVWDSECLFGTRVGNGGFMLYRNTTDPAGYYRIYFWYINTSDAVVGYRTWPGISDFAADTWYNLTMARSANGSLKFYRDGALVYNGTAPADFKAWHNSGAQLTFHSTANGGSYMNGDVTIDSIRVYSRTLSADEALYIYQNR